MSWLDPSVYLILLYIGTSSVGRGKTEVPVDKPLPDFWASYLFHSISPLWLDPLLIGYSDFQRIRKPLQGPPSHRSLRTEQYFSRTKEPFRRSEFGLFS